MHTQIFKIWQGFKVWIPCLLLKFWEYSDCITKYIRAMIYSTSEHPQYVGVWPIEGEMKDRFLYRNQNLKTKTSIQIVFFKKGGCLLPAIYPKWKDP